MPQSAVACLGCYPWEAITHVFGIGTAPFTSKYPLLPPRCPPLYLDHLPMTLPGSHIHRITLSPFTVSPAHSKIPQRLRSYSSHVVLSAQLLISTFACLRWQRTMLDKIPISRLWLVISVPSATNTRSPGCSVLIIGELVFPFTLSAGPSVAIQSPLLLFPPTLSAHAYF